MSVFVGQKGASCDFPNSDTWVILSPIEQSIKRKIELVGTPLKDWDIDIYRGVLTGCNEAFIITTAKREEILASCESEDERNRTAELIRPILRGRDIRRYAYEWQGLYLINTHNGLYEKLQRIDINKYPAVKHWLDVGGLAYNGKIYRGFEQLAERQDQGDTPYNLRACKYLEDFQKPKIVYSEIVQEPQFYLDNDRHFYAEATTFIMTGEHLEYLIDMLNSPIVAYFFKTFYAGGGLGTNGYRYKKNFLRNLPIPKSSGRINSDEEIYNLYDLSSKQIEFIKSQLG